MRGGAEAGPEHGKELHLLAHSMGGLVARWFIEREGGDRVVQHLIMLGTPNGGSPWSDAVGWTTTVIAIGLNGLARIPWPPTVLGTLLKYATKLGGAAARHADKLEISLSEMRPGSTFLAALGNNKSMGVPYSLLAGNTSLVAKVLESEDGKGSRIHRLLRALRPGALLSEGATALAFFGLPNDIAVSVEAMVQLPAGLEPRPVFRQVACDHMTYFTSEAGMHEQLSILR